MTANGVVVQRDDLTILDTRAMPWEDHPSGNGGKVKILSRDEDGNPTVFLNWVPPGVVSDVPRRHYHRTVLERAYVLAGELPDSEYEDADGPGQLVVLKPGHFIDRRPGSIHGFEAGAASPVGLLMLEWRTGPGEFLFGEGVGADTVVVSPPSGASTQEV